jgi:hypothetical protein
MEDNEGMEFWKAGKEAGADDERVKTSEMDDEELSTMKLKVPKPIFSQATKCKITDLKFFKLDEKEKDKKGNEYTPFFITLTFVEEGKGTEFRETYRGGRVYENAGRTSIYIGPSSALGRLKATCADFGISIGNTVKEWSKAMLGLMCTLKSETVMYQGKKYEKNYLTGIIKQ